jgi:UDPglucose 6-dehydrogenase/GDP-mannose 6-dehydrogenase
VRVAVIGTGYVGLVSGVCLAAVGHDVVCVERDAARVARIARGEVPIHEPGLDAMLAEQLGSRFSVTDALPTAVAGAEVTLIAVGTPSRDGAIDLADVAEAARQVGASLPAEGYPTVVVKSTVIPSTTAEVVRPALEEASGRQAGVGFGLGVNPEFLTEGRAVADFMEPDRIVIGADDDRSMEVLRRLYAPFADVPVLEYGTRGAELTKYASNALLATAISFSNELANFAEAIGGGIDIAQVMRGVHASRYLTPVGSDGPPAELSSFLMAGCGFGGSCLPKDVAALVAAGGERGEEMPLLRAVLGVNDGRAERMIRHLRAFLPDLRGARVGVLGLAFKPDTGDVRESPAVPLIERLLAEGAAVVAHDPVVTRSAFGTELDGVEFSAVLEDVVASADALVLVTSWDEYRRVPELLALRSDGAPPLIDGRRLIDPSGVDRYAGIGRA